MQRNQVERIRARLASVRGWQMRQRAREVLSVLLDRCEEGDDVVCCPSVEDIAVAARMSVRTAQRALRDLEQGTFIATKLRPIRPKLNDTNLYRILPAGGDLLDLPRSLRAPSTPRAGSPSRVSAETPVHFQSVDGAGTEEKTSGSEGRPPSAAAARRGRVSFVEAVAAELRREDEEADRVMAMIGVPKRPEQAAGSVSPDAPDVPGGDDIAELWGSISNEEPQAPPVDRTPPASESTPPAERVQKGGTPKGGAVAPSEIHNLLGDRSRGRARVRLSDPRAAMVVKLIVHGLADLAAGGYENRLLGIATREQVTVHRLLAAVGAVGERRARDIAEGGERAERWAGPPERIKPYLYTSVRNEVREQKAERERAREACDRRRRLHLREMQESSLGKAGQIILAALREHDVLARVATVDFAHRLVARTKDGAAGGRLDTEDVVHVIGQAAENERDKVATGEPRPQGQLATFVRLSVERAAPGVAKGASAGRGANGGGAPRQYSAQGGGTADETWDW